VRATAILCSAIGALLGNAPFLFWRLWGAEHLGLDLEVVAMSFVCGAIGGFAFWLVARRELDDAYAQKRFQEPAPDDA